jgi:hypothetical protein
MQAALSPPRTTIHSCSQVWPCGGPIDPHDSNSRYKKTKAEPLANSKVSVYTLIMLLGHESVAASQRYVTAAGTETRTAAAQNRLYGS